MIETGCGASSIAMFLHCAIYGGKMYSWDINGSKGSFIRTVISESICRILNVDVNKIWNFVSSSSTDQYTGISILKELKKKQTMGFLTLGIH